MKTISQAFVNFQAMVKTIKKSKVADSGKFSYTYAELSEIVEAIQPALAANDLAFRQKAITTPEYVSVQTILIHACGEEWDCGTFSLPVVDKNPQKMGGLLTYCRRYSLTTGLSICVSDSCEADMDANGDDVTITEKPTTKKETKKVELGAWKQLAKNNSGGQRTSLHGRLEMKRFFAICSKKEIEEQKQKGIIYLHTGKTSRKDVTNEEYMEINRNLQDATSDDITEMIRAALDLFKKQNNG